MSLVEFVDKAPVRERIKRVKKIAPEQAQEAAPAKESPKQIEEPKAKSKATATFHDKSKKSEKKPGFLGNVKRFFKRKDSK